MVSRGEMYCYRYAPILPGEYRIYERRGKTVCKEYGFTAVCGDRHGFVKVSEKDRRYFAYTDSNPFMPIGINMAFPQSFAVSDGSEFGQSDNIAYIGLKQYETWFKKANENGVNLVRIWCGHTYFSVDTNEAGVFHIEQFAKLDRINTLKSRTATSKRKSTIMKSFVRFPLSVRLSTRTAIRSPSLTIVSSRLLSIRLLSVPLCHSLSF